MTALMSHSLKVVNIAAFCWAITSCAAIFLRNGVIFRRVVRSAVTLSGGKAVHYRCDEENGWDPDLADIESKITENTHGLVIINPNNPTGAVYSEETVRGLVFLDEAGLGERIAARLRKDGHEVVTARPGTAFQVEPSPSRNDVRAQSM